MAAALHPKHFCIALSAQGFKQNPYNLQEIIQNIFGRVGAKYKSSKPCIIPPGGSKGFLKHRDTNSHEGIPKVFQPAKEME